MKKKCTVGFSIIAGLALLLAALPFSVVNEVAAQDPEAQLLGGNLDEEIVIVRNNRIAIYDPYPYNGKDYVEFYDAGGLNWRDVATGDFNGDGDDEIAVIDKNDASRTSTTTRYLRVYDPVYDPLPQMTFNLAETVTGNRVWWHIATGDVNGDGKDEIVAVTKQVSGPTSEFSVFAPASSSPLLCSGTVNGGEMNGLTLADLDNDGRDEIVFAGHAEGTYEDEGQMWFFAVEDGNSTCVKLYPISGSNQKDGVMYDLATGDVDMDGEDEVILAADPGKNPDPDGEYKSIAIWSHWRKNPEDRDGWWKYNYRGWGFGIPDDKGKEFQWGFIDAGDLNGDGDDEIVAIRNLHADVDSLIILDPRYTSSSTKLNKSYFNDEDSNSFQSVKIGRFDGSKPYELLALLSRDRIYIYRVYSQSGSVKFQLLKNWKNNISGFADEQTKVMAVGDFDGGKLQSTLPQNLITFFQDDERSFPDGRAEFTVSYPASTNAVVTATVSSPAPWLNVTPSGPTVLPATFTVSADTDPMPPLGTYSTTLTIDGTVNGIPIRGALHIPVTLNVIDEVLKQYAPQLYKKSN